MNWLFKRRRRAAINLPRAGTGDKYAATVESIPITDDVVQYVEDLCADHVPTFVGFPVDPDSCRKFALWPADEKHILDMLERVPALGRLQDSIVPSQRTQQEFWWIYFTLVRQHFKIAPPRSAAPVELVSLSSPSFPAMVPPMGYSQGMAPLSLAMSPGNSSLSTVSRPIPNNNAALVERGKTPVTIKQRNRAMAEALFDYSDLTASDMLAGEIRRGMTHARGKLWQFITGWQRYMQTDDMLFRDTLRSTLGSDDPIPLLDLVDFGGTFREEDHGLRPEESVALRNMLFIVAADQTEEAFLPFMPDLLSILIKSLSADKAYTTAVILLLRSMLDGRLFPTTRRAHWREMNAFDRAVRNHVPLVYEKMGELGIDVSDFAVNWFNRLFVGQIPSDILLRMIDCFFVDGRVVLFRVGIALIQLCQPTLLAATAPNMFMSALASAGRDHASHVMQASFDVPVFDNELERTDPDPAAHSRLLQSVLQSRQQHAEGDQEQTGSQPQSPPRLSLTLDDLVKIENPSSILSQRQFEIICEWLPTRLLTMDPILLFTTSRDGCALSRLFHHCEARDSLLLVIETASRNVFGVYIPTVLRPSPGRYYGTGESFLFTMTPTAERYEWEPGNKSYFMNVENRAISFGGGGGVGLQLDDELNKGFSQSCDTYHNKPLNYGSEDFDVVHVEVINFQ